MEIRPCSKKLRLEMDCDAEEGKEDSLELTVGGGHNTKEARGFLYMLQPIPKFKVPQPGVIFVFEKASLVHAQVGKTEQIPSSDVHADYLRKKNLDPANYRPDIIHEVLVSLYRSRLNLAGRIHKVYIKTDDGKLIKMQPNISIPDTVRNFGAMMAKLFQEFCIRPKGERKEKLMQLMANPVTKYFPINSHIIGLSRSGKKVTSVRDNVSTVNMDQTLVFVVGAMAHGKFDDAYTNDLISVSDMPLTAAKCVWKLCYELERRGKIL